MSSSSRQPDETDWSIIELVRAGVVSNSAIAAQLGLSEGTVRQRIKRLKESGVLAFRGLIDPDVLTNRQLTLMGANVTESRLLDAKAREIAELPNVLSVSIASGRFDLIIEVLVDSNHGLVDFLINEISAIEGISKTESFLLLKTYSKFV
ncbi:MAG: Lrp/AsnC family transcriptional regulator [Spirochaetaceae bacterium]